MQDIIMRAITGLIFVLATTLPAAAGDGFNIVIPGRPGVPIIINGVDASYRVIEGDYGLRRGVHMQPTVYGGRPIDPQPDVGHYYPSLGHQPGYGRLEVEPPKNRKLPQPAESYHEHWSARSAPMERDNGVPANPPEVLVAPRNPMR
jgi:hypothetical protein